MNVEIRYKLKVLALPSWGLMGKQLPKIFEIANMMHSGIALGTYKYIVPKQDKNATSYCLFNLENVELLLSTHKAKNHTTTNFLFSPFRVKPLLVF